MVPLLLQITCGWFVCFCLLRFLITSAIQVYNKSTIYDPFLPHLRAELHTCDTAKRWLYAVKLNSDVHFLFSQSSTYSVLKG